MATPLTPPNFVNKSTLSLTELDTLARCVRDAQQPLRSVGPHTPRGHARAHNAWYIPVPRSLDADRQVTCIAPGLIAGVGFSREYTVPMILDGQLMLPMAHNEAKEDEDAPEESLVLCYPGAIDRVVVQDESSAVVENGAIKLPLAHSPTIEVDEKTGEAGEVAAGWPGLLQAVAVVPDARTPTLSSGVLQLPLACGAKATALGDGTSLEDSGVGPLPGLLQDVQVDPTAGFPWLDAGILYLPAASAGSGIKKAMITSCSRVEVKSGVLYFPLVESGSAIEGCSVSTIPGAIAGISISSYEAAGFCSGVLQFPLAEGLSSTIAEGCTVSSVPGAMVGALIDDGITEPHIESGVLHLPPAGVKSMEFTKNTDVTVDAGVLYFPLAQATIAAAGCTVSSVPGAIAGVCTNEQATAPFIADGVLNMPPAEGRLKGVRASFGEDVAWQDLKDYAGEQVPVASCFVRIGTNTYASVSLDVGMNAAGFLTFSLTSG